MACASSSCTHGASTCLKLKSQKFHKMLNISSDGKSPKIITRKNLEEYEQYLAIETDHRLLSRLMRGPKFAHWNNAEIGSRLKFIRNPNVYERGLFYCLNFFHI